MYSKVLALDEAVRRNLGLRMVGEVQWMILRFLDDLCSFLLQRQLAQPATLVELAWPLSSEQAAPSLLLLGNSQEDVTKE